MCRKKSAFTLIEILIVIVIIAILAAMMLTGIRGAMRMAKRTQATAEVKNIASALEFYYGEYHRWPPTLGTDPEGTPVPINLKVSKMLQGENDTTDKNNLKKIKFMQFKAFDTTKTDPTEYPVNPWWYSGVTGNVEYLYYFKVDADFDNKINAGAPPTPPTKILRRRVLVWTKNNDNGSFITSADGE